ncbi:MAG: methionyl-tRNA formyltransferase [Chloroflexi bacterium RBG_13_46_14]|nr:MAG: methionyl-tRNA formyltransferase [Chloroflexi bacterium RBG_13_46_14]
MGTPWFAVPTLEYLLLNGYEIAAVYTQPDRESGRGRSVIASPVKRKAIEYGLPVEQPDNFKEGTTVDRLAAYKPDYILIYSYGQILPQTVIDIPSRDCLAIHPSLLPRHRGAAPVVSAILSGDEFTGTTLIRVALKVDSGDILGQVQVPVTDYDTTEILTGKLSLVSAQMVLDVLPRLVKNEVIPRQQGASLANYFGQLSKQDGEIDWKMPAVDIWRRVRAYNPWPGCYTKWNGKQLKILKAKPSPFQENTPPGRVVTLPDKHLLGISTGDGILAVSEVQLEGKKGMSARDFIQGQRNIIGAVLPSGS